MQLPDPQQPQSVNLRLIHYPKLKKKLWIAYAALCSPMGCGLGWFRFEQVRSEVVLTVNNMSLSDKAEFVVSY